jgi:hypothetical protein
MKTHDLISLLSTNVEPVDYRQIRRTLGIAVAAGGAAVIATVVFALGFRADLTTIEVFIPLLLKVAFALVVLIPASIYLIRLADPGGERRTSVGLVALPFIAVMVLAAVSLTVTPRSHWNAMIIGNQWLECLISIPLIAVLPFAVIVWAVRRMAPTDLRRTGTLVGLVAGSLSAAGYAFHCADDSVPFVALWYGGTIALCTLFGWQLGPRLLRW